MKEHEIVSAVQQSTGIDDQHSAERAVRATLKVLGDRLAGGEPRDLAAQLPPALAEVLPAEGAGERFEVDEFYPRVAEQEGAEVGVATARPGGPPARSGGDQRRRTARPAQPAARQLRGPVWPAGPVH